MKIDGSLSEVMYTSTGTPQGCILSPMLFTLYTYDCVASFDTNCIIKYADDTTIIGLISANDDSCYREEVQNVVEWSKENNLLLNTSKTCELVIDFSPNNSHVPLVIDDSSVQIVEECTFLGLTLSKDLTWSKNTTNIVKKSRQRLYFLRKLGEFTQNSKILLNFYRCRIESLLVSSVTVWFRNITDKEKRALYKVVRSARRTVHRDLPVLETLYKSRLLNRALQILNDPSHPGRDMFELLPSGRRYRSIGCRSARHARSFFPRAVASVNNAL